jgi:hypothetical protein
LIDLAAVQIEPAPRQVVFAFRAFPDLCATPLSELAPLGLVEKMADRFGLEFQLAGTKGRYFFEQWFGIPAGVPLAQLIQVSNPKQHSFMQSFFLSPKPDAIGVFLAFCLDTTEYGQWLGSH